jgi:L-ribulose-5-phosphate 3-epimerase
MLIGVMQGRLLPKYKGRYQAHPVGYWQDEFFLAKQLGLGCIEFILDYNEMEKNPLMYYGGVNEILKVSEQTGVAIKTVCADYFMVEPIHSENSSITEKSLKVLDRLIRSSVDLGITDIVLPCVDRSSLRNSACVDRLVFCLRGLLDKLEKFDINLCLETDLDPYRFMDLLDRCGSKKLSVNYDTGNSAALGYDPALELSTYGDRVTDLHIKDRIYQGGPVELGKGDTKFEAVFQMLKQLDYDGPCILQAFRDDEGIEVFKKQLEWLTPLIESLHK